MSDKVKQNHFHMITLRDTSPSQSLNIEKPQVKADKIDSFATKKAFKLNNLKVLEPIEAHKEFYSRVISFNVKKDETPKFSYSASSIDKPSLTKSNIMLGDSPFYNDEAVKITKKATVDKTTGELVDVYTIGVKKNNNVNFVIGTSEGFETINYDAPFTSATIVQTPLVSTPSAPVVAQASQPKPKFSLPRVSSDKVLPYSSSGKNKYSSKGSIFATSSQDEGCPVSYPDYPWDAVDIKKYAKSQGSDYSKLRYGVPIFRGMAQAIADSKGKIAIEEALVQSHKELSKIDSYKPEYRIGDKAKCDSSQDFEVLFVVGSYYGKAQETAFKLDAEVTKDAITTFYPDRCKHFQTEIAPKREDFKTMLKERIQSAKENGRKLYFFYSGHGGIDRSIEYQSGISDADKVKQGSKEFKFCINDHITESEMKELLGDDVEFCVGIDACHGDAAVTAAEQEKQKEYFSSLA